MKNTLIQNIFKNYSLEELKYLFYAINLTSKEVPNAELSFEPNEILFTEHFVSLKYNIKLKQWFASWLDSTGGLMEFNSTVVRQFKKEVLKQYTEYKEEPVYLTLDNKPHVSKITVSIWYKIYRWFKNKLK